MRISITMLLMAATAAGGGGGAENPGQSPGGHWFGNYTLSISAGPNSLNIAADGTIFGMWDSGDQCTVNGRVSTGDNGFTAVVRTYVPF